MFGEGKLEKKNLSQNILFFPGIGGKGDNLLEKLRVSLLVNGLKLIPTCSTELVWKKNILNFCPFCFNFSSVIVIESFA